MGTPPEMGFMQALFPVVGIEMAWRDAVIEYLAQLLYDANGDPLEGWEDVAEAHDQSGLRKLGLQLMQDRRLR